MEIKTEITSQLNEKRIKELLPDVVINLLKGKPRLIDGSKDLQYETLICKNGGAIYLHENASRPNAQGQYRSYSWGMFIVTDQEFSYYQLSDDMNRKTLPLEEHQLIMAGLGPEVPAEKKNIFSKKTVPNPEYIQKFNKLAQLTEAYCEEIKSKTK